MTLKHYILALSALLLLSACRKQEDPRNENGEPVFGITGTIDNRPVQFIAGEGSYMHTDYEVDSSDILIFKGDLKEDCPGCTRSLKIMIRNNRPGMNVTMGQSISLKDYPFVGSSFPQQCVAYFRATGTGQGSATHTWTFLDGSSFTGDSVSKVFTPPLNTIVKCLSQYASCSSVIEAPVSFRPPTAPSGLTFAAIPIDSLQRLFRFEASATDSLGSLMQWDFGDGQSSTGAVVSHMYSDSQPFVKRVTLSQVIFSQNDTIRVSQNIATNNYVGCMANFSVSRQYQDDPYLFSGVIVEWTDANGVIYSSKNVIQDASSKFTITKISEYLSNQRGQKTLALDLLINCNVSDGSRTIPLRNLSGRMAIAYP